MVLLSIKTLLTDQEIDLEEKELNQQSLSPVSNSQRKRRRSKSPSLTSKRFQSANSACCNLQTLVKIMIQFRIKFNFISLFLLSGLVVAVQTLGYTNNNQNVATFLPAAASSRSYSNQMICTQRTLGTQRLRIGLNHMEPEIQKSNPSVIDLTDSKHQTIRSNTLAEQQEQPFKSNNLLGQRISQKLLQQNKNLSQVKLCLKRQSVQERSSEYTNDFQIDSQNSQLFHDQSLKSNQKGGPDSQNQTMKSTKVGKNIKSKMDRSNAASVLIESSTPKLFVQNHNNSLVETTKSGFQFNQNSQQLTNGGANNNVVNVSGSGALTQQKESPSESHLNKCVMNTTIQVISPAIQRSLTPRIFWWQESLFLVAACFATHRLIKGFSQSVWAKYKNSKNDSGILSPNSNNMTMLTSRSISYGEQPKLQQMFSFSHQHQKKYLPEPQKNRKPGQMVIKLGSTTQQSSDQNSSCNGGIEIPAVVRLKSNELKEISMQYDNQMKKAFDALKLASEFTSSHIKKQKIQSDSLNLGAKKRMKHHKKDVFGEAEQLLNVVNKMIDQDQLFSPNHR